MVRRLTEPDAPVVSAAPLGTLVSRPQANTTEAPGGRGRAASIIRTSESRKEVPRVSLPFQVIETVNESRATREANKGGVQAPRFDVCEGNDGHRQGLAG